MSSQKRKTPASAGASAKKDGGTKSSARNAKKSKSSLNEDDLAVTQGQELTKKQQQERTYWEQYETPLLAAWLVDYAECSMSYADLVSNRDPCLDAMCSNDWVKRPDGKKDAQLQSLQQIWIQHRPADAPSTLPGRIVISPHKEDDDMKDPDDPMDTGLEPAAAAAAEKLAAEEAEKKKTLQQKIDEAALGLRTPNNTIQPFKQSFSLADAKGNPLNGGEYNPPPPTITECVTCLASKPIERLFAIAWICSCGLRGDVPSDHPANFAFAEAKLIKLRADAAAASALVAVAPSGKSTADTSSEDSTAVPVDALDKHYAIELKAGLPYPLYSGPTAHVQITAADALTRSREAAFNGLAYHPPSDQLIALIQSGKFWRIGHAIPRPLIHDGGEDLGATQLVMSGNSIVAKSKVPPPPPNCDSLASFAEAFFGTIGPALIDRPEALLNWMTMARTALEINRTHHWRDASTYLTQHLSHKVAQRLPFMSTTATIIASLPPPSRQQQQVRPGQQPADATRQQGPFRVCFDWNQQRCTRPVCERSHTCVSCNGQHPGIFCPTKPIQRQAPRVAATGGKPPFAGKSSPATRRADDASSVRSAPTKTGKEAEQ